MMPTGIHMNEIVEMVKRQGTHVRCPKERASAWLQRTVGLSEHRHQQRMNGATKNTKQSTKSDAAF
jgi:hypothetical protein